MPKLQATRFNIHYFLFYGAFASLLSLISIYFRNNLGFDDAQVGTILSSLSIIGIIVQPIWGILADNHLGPKKILLISTLFSGIAVFFLSFSTTYPAVLITYIIFGIFYAAIIPMSDSIALKFTEKHPFTNFGSIRSFGSIGYAILALTMSLIASRFGLHISFYVYITFALLCTLNVTTLPDHNKHKDKPEKQPASLLFKNIPLMIFFLYAFLLLGCHNGAGSYLTLYMNSRGASLSLIGLLFFFMASLEVPVLVNAKKIVARFSPIQLLIFVSLIGGTRLILLSLNLPLFLLIFVANIQCFFIGLLFPTQMEIIKKLCPPALFSTALGFYAAFIGVGTFIGTNIAGYISNQFNYATTFRLFGIIILALTLFMYGYTKLSKKTLF